MPTISNHDIIRYYDLTEQHMRWFWKLDEGMGIHYGVWDENTKSLAEALINTNRVLAEMGGIQKGHKVLDAGCGVGGSSIYIAKHIGAHCTGITLSAKQVESANRYAAKNGVADRVHFEVNDYFDTGYPENSFDYVWALESMATAHDKSLFLKEAYRVLKPGGRLIISDYYKPFPYNTDDHKCMQHMLHHWMVPDILTVDEQKELAKKSNFSLLEHRNYNQEIKKTVTRIYWFALLGMLGTKAYTLTHSNVTSYSKNHYKTGLGQFKGYKKGLWEYHAWVLEKPEA